MVEKMSNAPVYYALVQAQFNPVAMYKYVDEIQDILRRKGYPLFDRQEMTELIVPSPNGGQQTTDAEIRKSSSWLIAKRDRTCGFILAPSSITFHTTHYDTHSQFIPAILEGLAAVHKIVGLDHLSRLGMRYLDAVMPKKSEEVEQYLVKGLHGIDSSDKPRQVLVETIFNTSTGPLCENGTLVQRIFKTKGRLGFPADLSPHGLAINGRFDLERDDMHAIIDTDHYVDSIMSLDNESLLSEQLKSLHSGIKDTFNLATTSHARAVWA